MIRLKNLANRTLNFELPAFLLVTFIGMATDRFVWLNLMVIGAFWGIRLFAKKRLVTRTAVDWAVGIIVLLALFTLWITIDPQITTPNVVRLLTGIALFYAISDAVSTKRRIQIAILATGLIAAGLSSIAPFSVEWTTSKLPFIPASIYDLFTNIVPDSIHRNVFAGYVIIFISPVIALLLFSWKKLNKSLRVFLLITAVLGSSIFLLAQSRGSLIAFGVTLIVLISLRFRFGWGLIPISVLAVAVASYVIGIDQVLDLVSSNVSLGGFDVRLEIWARGIYMIQDFPISGVGMGLFGPVADLLYPFFLVPPGTVPHAHNLFIQIAVDLGMPGLIAWLTIFILVIHKSWMVFRFGIKNGEALAAGLGAGLLASQVALATHGIFDAVTWGMVKPAPLVWALWGLAFSAGNVFLSKNNSLSEALEPTPVEDNK